GILLRDQSCLIRGGQARGQDGQLGPVPLCFWIALDDITPPHAIGVVQSVAGCRFLPRSPPSLVIGASRGGIAQHLVCLVYLACDALCYRLGSGINVWVIFF